MNCKLALLGLMLLGSTMACKDEAAPDEETPVDPPATDPVGSVNDDAGFYVRVHDSPNIMQRLHQDDDPTNTDECVINADDADKDITCVVDVPEEDLYFHGVNFQYNVPSTMCTYLHFNSYYYENFQIGQVGSAEASREIASSFNVYKEGETYGFDDDGAGSPDPAAAAPDGITGFNDEGEPECAFDYSGGDVVGPNCCVGTSNYTLYTRDDADAAWEASSVRKAWGGTASTCLAGPATESHPKTAKGFPKTLISFVDGTGLNAAYEIRSPMEVWGLFWNLWTANFHTDAFVSSPNGLTPHALPGHGDTAFQPYEWSCVDRNADVIARISLYVREWNAFDEWENLGSAETTGPEGNPFGGDLINDMADWKDADGFYGGYPQITGINAPTTPAALVVQRTAAP